MGANRKLSGAMKLWAVAALFAVMHTATAATVGPVTDDLGVVRIAKGAPIKIGGYWVMSGADTALGLDGKRGAEIAFDDIDNKLPAIRSSSLSRTICAMPRAARRQRPSLHPIRRSLPCSARPAPARPLPPHRSCGSRHHQYRQCDVGALAHRAGPQAVLLRLRPHDLEDIDQGASTPKYFYTELKARRSPPFMTAAPTPRSWPRSPRSTSRNSAARCVARRR